MARPHNWHLLWDELTTTRKLYPLRIDMAYLRKQVTHLIDCITNSRENEFFLIFQCVTWTCKWVDRAANIIFGNIGIFPWKTTKISTQPSKMCKFSPRNLWSALFWTCQWLHNNYFGCGFSCSGDHTFWITKHMRLEGSRPFTTCFKLMNEFGLVMAFYMVGTAGLWQIAYVFQAMYETRIKNGYVTVVSNRLVWNMLCMVNTSWNSSLFVGTTCKNLPRAQRTPLWVHIQ